MRVARQSVAQLVDHLSRGSLNLLSPSTAILLASSGALSSCSGGGAGVGSFPLASAGLPPAAGGSMEFAVGSLDAGQPSSRRTSFGLSTLSAPRDRPQHFYGAGSTAGSMCRSSYCRSVDVLAPPLRNFEEAKRVDEAAMRGFRLKVAPSGTGIVGDDLACLLDVTRVDAEYRAEVLASSPVQVPTFSRLIAAPRTVPGFHHVHAIRDLGSADAHSWLPGAFAGGRVPRGLKAPGGQIYLVNVRSRYQSTVPRETCPSHLRSAAERPCVRG